MSKVSDHESRPEVRAEDTDGDRATSAASAVPESPLFDVPGEEDELEEKMPWLKVVSRVANGFNFYCTHQGFCHPSCFRRQMRASKRIMVAARRVSEDEEARKDVPSIGRNSKGCGFSCPRLWPDADVARRGTAGFLPIFLSF